MSGYECIITSSKRWELALNGSFLTAASLMGRHDAEVANVTAVGGLKKSIMSSIGGEIVENPHQRKDADYLSGKFREGTTVLITDLQ